MAANPFETDLDKNPANHTPLSPGSSLTLTTCRASRSHSELTPKDFILPCGTPKLLHVCGLHPVHLDSSIASGGSRRPMTQVTYATTRTITNA